MTCKSDSEYRKYPISIDGPKPGQPGGPGWRTNVNIQPENFPLIAPRNAQHSLAQLQQLVERKQRSHSWETYLDLRESGHHLYLGNDDYVLLLIHYIPSMARQLRTCGIHRLRQHRVVQYYPNYRERDDQEEWLPVWLRPREHCPMNMMTRVRKLAEDWLARETTWQTAPTQGEVIHQALKMQTEDYRIMILALCQLRCYDLAEQVLETMQQRTVSPTLDHYSPFLAVYTDLGLEHKVVALMDTLERQGLQPDYYQLRTMVSFFAHKGSLDLAEQYYAVMVRERMLDSANEYLGVLIQVAQTGLAPLVYRVYTDLQAAEYSLYPHHYNALANGFALISDLARAEEMIRRTLQSGSRPSFQALCRFFSKSRKLENPPARGLALSRSLRTLQIKLRDDVKIQQMAIHAASGDAATTMSLYREINFHRPGLNSISFNVAITALLDAGGWEEADKLLALAKLGRFQPDRHTYYRILLHTLRTRRFDLVPQLYKLFVEDQLDDDGEVVTMFAKLAVLQGDMSQLQNVTHLALDKVRRFTTGHANRILAFLLGEGLWKTALDFYRIPFSKLDPDAHTYTLLMSVFRHMDDVEGAEKLVTRIRTEPFTLPLQGYADWLAILAHHGQAERVKEVYQELRSRTVSWEIHHITTVINAQFQVHAYEAALALYDEMGTPAVPCTPDPHLLRRMVQLCAIHGKYARITQLLQRCHTEHIPLSAKLYAKVIAAYVQCHQITAIRDLINSWRSTNQKWTPSEYTVLANTLGNYNETRPLLQDLNATAAIPDPTSQTLPEVSRPDFSTHLPPQVVDTHHSVQFSEDVLSTLAELTKSTSVAEMEAIYKRIQETDQVIPVDDQVWVALAQAFQRVAPLAVTLEVVNTITNRQFPLKVQLFNQLLHVLGKLGEFGRALELVDRMGKDLPHPTAVSFGTLVNCMINAEKLDLLPAIHQRWHASGVTPTDQLGTSFALAFSMVGKVALGCQWVDTVLERYQTLDVVTYNRLLRACAFIEQFDKAYAIFERRAWPTKQINPRTFYILLNACSLSDLSRTDLVHIREVVFQLYQYWQRTGFPWNAYVATKFIQTFSVLNEATRASELLETTLELLMDTASVDQINTLLTAFGKLGNVGAAQLLYRFMCQTSRIQFNDKTYVALAQVCEHRQSTLNPTVLWQEYLKRTFSPSIDILNRFLICFQRRREPWHMDTVLEALTQYELTPNTVTYGIQITRYCNQGRISQAYDLLAEMKTRGVEPSLTIYNKLVSVEAKAGNLAQTEILLRRIKEQGLSPSQFTYSAVMMGFQAVGRLTDAYQVYKTVRSQGIPMDERLFNNSVSVCLENGQLEEAMSLGNELVRLLGTMSPITFTLFIDQIQRPSQLDILQTMKRWLDQDQVSKPDATLYCKLILAYGRVDQLTQAFDIWDTLCQSNFPVDNQLCSALLWAAIRTGAPLETLVNALQQIHQYKPRLVQTPLLNTLMQLYSDAKEPDRAYWVFEMLFSRFQCQPTSQTMALLKDVAYQFDRPDIAQAARLLAKLEYPTLTLPT
ncbi:hypothetical protein IWQ61_003236 [Dispira simplex]|nr:hypothetical protein IWQ61_003236 [Dispira simplex]